MKKPYPYPLFILSLLFLIVGCQKEEQPEPAVLDLRQPWKVSRPAETGMDEMTLNLAINQAESTTRFLSLLVVKDGQLVVEKYFHGNARDSMNDVRSITKSITSSLVGIALAKGFLHSLDEPIGDYLHPHIAEVPEDKQKISIHDLLTMSAGLEWDEFSGDSYNQWIVSRRHIDYVIDLPLISEPGAVFNYNSGAAHLLGIVLEEATGMELEVFADQYLFSAIGIRQYTWENLPGGYVNSSSGIDLRPRDLARLGQLYLQEGENGPEQILSKEWVTQVKKPEFYMPWTYGALQSIAYGRLWWIEDAPADFAFFAWGHGGQFIYIVPSLELVVVTTTHWRQLSQEGGPRPLTEAAIAIISDIVQAVRE